MPKRDRIRELLDKSPRNSVPSQSVPHRPAVQNVLNEPTVVTTTAGGAAATKTAVTTQMATGNRGLQLATNDISMPFRRLTRTPSARLPSRSRTRAFFSNTKAYDEDHKQASRFRPHTEVLSRFLVALDRFMAGVAIGI
jgi:hypothetical protein